MEAAVPSGSASAVSCKYDDFRAKPFDATEFSELVEHYLVKGAPCQGDKRANARKGVQDTPRDSAHHGKAGEAAEDRWLLSDLPREAPRLVEPE